jgi:very-short-patch-repair endonuclease
MDVGVAELARRQHGVVSRAQLLELGLTPKSIKWRVSSGRLHPIHRGVYLVGHRKPLPRAREMAAVLACGPRALVSHLSAAWLWAIDERPRGPVQVTVVGADRRRPGIAIHRTSSLTRRDVRTLERIALTSPARTLLDVSALLPPAALERVVAEAFARNLTKRAELLDQLERHPGRPGTPSLLALVDGAKPNRTRNDAEARLLALVRSAGLAAPESNAVVGPYEVDLLWREQRVVVEFDSWRWHSSRPAFEADRRRDGDLAARGYTVIRVTWRQLTREPHAVVARVAAALALAQA